LAPSNLRRRRTWRGRNWLGSSAPFLTVLDAERTAADAAAHVAVTDGRIADAQIDLFRALGGGWQQAVTPATMASAQ
jgi:outer membrane protein TolC